MSTGISFPALSTALQTSKSQSSCAIVMKRPCYLPKIVGISEGSPEDEVGERERTSESLSCADSSTVAKRAVPLSLRVRKSVLGEVAIGVEAIWVGEVARMAVDPPA